MKVSGRVVITSCALFGFRKERDKRNYYRLLLNDLASKTDLDVVVATNEPDGWHERIQVEHIPTIDEMRRRLWKTENWVEEARRLIHWHPRNRGLYQADHPELVGVYIAKTAIMFDLVRRFGDACWIDAGFLFSVLSDHDVPADWKGYSAERIETKFKPWLATKQASQQPHLTSGNRRWRLFKNHRPSFHGLSYNDMTRLAAKCGATPDEFHAAASTQFIPHALVDQVEAEFAEIWQTMLDMGRCGTEETALSVLRWKNHYQASPYAFWLDMLAD